jgi:hypothetical protein
LTPSVGRIANPVSQAHSACARKRLDLALRDGKDVSEHRSSVLA